MPKKRTSPESAILKKLSLDLEHWIISIDYEKPFINNPQQKHSYVRVEIQHIPTSRKESLSQKGSFTKNEARNVAKELSESAILKLIKK